MYTGVLSSYNFVSANSAPLAEVLGLYASRCVSVAKIREYDKVLFSKMHFSFLNSMQSFAFSILSWSYENNTASRKVKKNRMTDKKNYEHHHNRPAKRNRATP